jgi:PAS domain S-box-containing protein
MAPQHQVSDLKQRIYNTILDHTPDFAYVWGLDYKFIYANKALTDLYGVTSEEIVGKGFRDLNYPEWHARMHEDEIDQVARTGQPLRGVIPFTGKSGGGVYDYIFIPVFDSTGQVEAVAGTTRDITELRNATEALEENDRRKDEFLSVLAHELRNPLAPLLNGMELLDMDLPPAETELTRRMMQRQLLHLKHLVDDLMEVSRINRGAVKMRMAPIDLSSVLTDVVEVMAPQIEKLGHRLEVHVNDSLPIMGDRTRLTQVLMNLLENACKYTPAGGRISLEARQEGDRVVVQVIDTGMGILPGDAGSIFTMFKQVQRDDAPKPGGLGIGLSLARQLVEFHNGSLSVHSAGRDKGSTFTVELPVDDTQHAQPPDQERPQRVIQQKVLVVDDNRDAADSLALMLTNMGHQVRTAYDGQEALSQVVDFVPEMIFLDLGMPRINGYETCVQMRRMPSLRNTRIYALSGWGQPEVRSRTECSGFEGHLVKPLEKSELLQVMGG